MRSRSPALAVLAASVLAAGGCATQAAVPVGPEPDPAEADSATATGPDRPIPYPVTPPRSFERAIREGTRTASGGPGPAYWQQKVDYDLDARVDAAAKRLEGSGRIVYHNRSPYRLPGLVIHLLQNYHAPGVARLRPAEVTGGIEVRRVGYRGRDLEETRRLREAGWLIDGTVMYVTLPEPAAPGGTAEVELEWAFDIPERGASARMGHTGDELLYLAYWFPQVAVFDDVIGWHTDPFLGNAEFYSDFGDYRLTVDAPEGWIVMGTGSLENADEVLAPEVAERLRASLSSDDVVHVVSHDDIGSATADSPTDRLQWEFVADGVRDVAFAVMRSHAWDAARSEIGDRDGDGSPEYARIDAFWRPGAVYHDDAWRYAQHSLAFFSEFTGLAYPWPHMTVVEGGGIISGGMEFPMMTLVGDYNARGDTALYGVIAHELAHMWLPMALSSNERRYAWLDEGTTSFNEDHASAAFFGPDSLHAANFRDYLQAVSVGWDGPIMRWSDLHRSGNTYGVASYSKPATALHALKAVLGDEAFMAGYRAFFDRWAFRHPYPWDLFNTFEDVTGEDLEWFWRSWYYESVQDGRWLLDHAVAGVERLADGRTRITVVDEGWIPMPVTLTVRRTDGMVLERTIPVDRWLEGATTVSVVLPAGAPVESVAIDAAGRFPDADRNNNVWER